MTSSPNTVVSLARLRCDNGLSVPVGQVLSVNSIINPLNNDVIVDATLTNNIVFRANATEQMRINSNGVQFNNFISLPVGNNINLGDSSVAETNAGYRIFQIVNPDPTGTFRIYIGDPASFGNQIFWMSNTGIVCRKPLEAGILTSNYINSVGDNDVVFARYGVGFFRLANAPAGYPILNWTNTTPSAGISSSVIFANTYTTRSENTDTVFRGNPMKTSLILWKALQESMTKISHLEASVYELQEAVKELKGKGKAKSKAKAKSKPKD